MPDADPYEIAAETDIVADADLSWKREDEEEH